LLYGMTVCSAQEPNLLKNAAFRTDPDANGRPRHWEGEPKLMQLVKSPYVQGRKAIRLERGGRLSQTVPAEAGRSYVVTVQADTIFYEEKGQFRYRSRAFAELAFLPSGEKARTEMVSPFGDCAELVPYAIGGTAPDGTQCVRVSIVTGAAPCVIGEARLVAYENSTEHFRLKDLHIDTAIVRDGRVAARIVVPESGVHDGSARKIAEKIRELTGVELPVVKDTGSDLCRGQRLTSSLIVFGNRNTNRVVGDLYDLYYCIIDLRYPGKGGSVVRSLHDPFGDGHNVIFVGASDAGGMEKATDAFVRVLDSAEASAGNLTVGYLADIEPGSDVAIPETMGFNDLRNVKPWDATNRTGGYGWTVITKAMAYYYLTGYEHYAKEFMRLAFPKDEQTFRDLKSCGQDFRGAVRKTEPLVNVYHYRAHLPIVYWDLIEESPFFSDEDRTKITGQFMKQVRKFVEDKNMGCETDKVRFPMATISTRHHQWAAMTFYTLGRYLGKYYPDYEWKRIRRSAENFYSGMYKKRHFYTRGEGAKLERYATTRAALFAYTLLSGNKYPVGLGSLAEQTKNLEVMIDWEKNAWVLRQAPTSLFNQMAYLFSNSRHVQARNLITVISDVFRPGQTYWPDESQLEFEPFGIDTWETFWPTDYERWFWSLLWGQELNGADRMFLLSSFRTSNDGKGDYLLFDGVHLGLVYHTFGMLEYVLNGDVLFQGNRTQINVVSDGMTSARLPKYCLLDRMAANGRSALIQAETPDYNLTNWRRSVLHRKGQYTLFVDRLRSLEDTTSSTVEINWALAGGAAAADVHPGSVTIRVSQTGDAEPLHTFQAVRCPDIRSNLPEDKIIRATYDAARLVNQDKGGYLEFRFEVEEDVEGEMIAEFLNSRGSGFVRLDLDDRVLAEKFDHGSKSRLKVERLLLLGQQKLCAGKHVLRIESLGRSPNSAGNKIAFRGLKIFKRLRTGEYCLSFADKVKTTLREMGTSIGSTASGGLVSTCWTDPLERGAERIFMSLVTPKLGSSDVGNCLRIAPNAAVLQLSDGHAIAVHGEHGDIRGETVVAGAGHITAYGATRCGPFVESDKPVDLDWDFAAGALAMDCADTTAVTLTLEGDQIEWDGETAIAGSRIRLVLGKGEHLVQRAKPRASLVAQKKQEYAALFSEARAQRVSAPVQEPEAIAVTAPQLKEDWRTTSGEFPSDMEVFRLAGRPRIAVAEDKAITVFDGDGKMLRKLATDDLVRVIHYWPETQLLVAGCYDFKAIAFDAATGERRWAFESKEINPVLKRSGASGWYCRGPIENNGIHALDSGVFLNGESQLFVGTVSTLEIVDRDGQLLHSTMTGAGMVTGVARVEWGEGEIKLLPARQFGSFRMHRIGSSNPQTQELSQGVGPFAPRRGASTYEPTIGGGYVFLEADDLDGDGAEEVIGLYNGLLNGLHVWDNKGNVLADAAFGDGRGSPRPSYEKRIDDFNMRGLSAADLNGDGRKELCVITSRGFLIVLSDRCKKLWARRLPSDPFVVQAFAARNGAKGCIIVGCRDGSVYKVDPAGAFAAQAGVKGTPAKMARLDRARAVIATNAGELVAYYAAP